MKCPLKLPIQGCSILILLSPAPPSVHSKYSMMKVGERERERQEATSSAPQMTSALCWSRAGGRRNLTLVVSSRQLTSSADFSILSLLGQRSVCVCVCMWTSVCGNKNTPCYSHHCCNWAFLTLGSFGGLKSSSIVLDLSYGLTLCFEDNLFDLPFWIIAWAGKCIFF